MTDERKRNLRPLVATTILLLLLGVYVVAYYAMVTPVDYWSVKLPFFGLDSKGLPVEAIFGIPHDQLIAFFRPIHQIDRRIRPHVWGTP